jgi:hypothetical protein
MEKSHYNKEANRLSNEAEKLREKAELDLATAEFFNAESQKLEMVLDNEESTDDQIDDALIKLEALYNRIQIELNESDEESIRIERELLVLHNKAINEGLI